MVHIPTADGEKLQHRNEVALSGKVAAAAQRRTLPSGDVLVTFRLVVSRGQHHNQPRNQGPDNQPGPDPAYVARPRSPAVDTIDCACWDEQAGAEICSWGPGDVVEVKGSLRRRFWRTPSGPASRSEVEVSQALRLQVADLAVQGRSVSPMPRRDAAPGDGAAQTAGDG